MAILPLLLLSLVQSNPTDETFEVIKVGHWLEIRGLFDENDVLQAQDVELKPPEKYELIIGTPTEKRAEGEFLFHGQPIHVSEDTEFDDFTGDEDDLAGTRAKIEGYWRDSRKFSARDVSDRGPGRERIGGRVDEIRRVEGGYMARIMTFDVFIPDDAELELPENWKRIPLIAPRGSFLSIPRIDSFYVRTGGKDEDDLFGEGFELAPNLFFATQLETQATYEDDFNLDDTDAEDRQDYDLRIRGRLVYIASENLAFISEVNQEWRYRDDQDAPSERNSDTNLSETFGYWKNFVSEGFDLQVGRQDFDEKREWIYDQNLDAVRVIADIGDVTAELSVSTVFADEGNATDRNSRNLIGYVSNGNFERHLAGWFVARDIDGNDLPIGDQSLLREDFVQFGGRALGDWIPDNESWIDLAVHDLEGFGLDIGTTWEIDDTPFYLTAGYAFGSEDYRQTGFSDNNDKFGGVTSFRLYGELLEPELANMHISTLGVGAILMEETSLDLVWHGYRQSEAIAVLADVQVDPDPNGVDEDLGWELDLILGCRRWRNWDVEIVGAYFSPGDAFDAPEDDPALLGKLQIRYRL